MKKHILAGLILSLLLSTFSIDAQQTYINKRGDTHLLGAIELSDLTKEPYADWYTKRFNDYNGELQSQAISNLKDVKVKVFLGTWCGDTKGLLPHFTKLWKDSGLSESQLELIALHNEDKEYKRSPSRIEAEYNIHRVPTFVFERDGKEIGRIVERPLNDLTTDINQIGQGIPSQSRYRAIALLHEYYLSQPEDSLFTNLNGAIRSIYRNVSGSGELNTYGYVLMTAERFKEAELAFYTNTILFPYDPNLYDSLGELYMEIEKYPEAKDCFEKVIDIKKEDVRATNMLSTIKEKLEN